jgi:integrase
VPSALPLLTFVTAMAKVNFSLNNPQPDKPTSILVQLYISRAIRPTFATGEHCKPENWDGSRVTPASKGTPTKGDAANINRHLAQIEADLMEVWRDNKSAGRDHIKAKAFEAINGVEAVQKKTVETWMREFIKVRWKKKSTRQVYNATVDHLEGYAKKNNIDITWETFNMGFYHSFKDYLYSLGHNDNTVGKYLKKAKQLISEGFENDEHANINFKKKAFRASIEAETDEIYLSEEEIIKIYNLDIAELEDVKKRFVFSCWVGLRFGDISKLSPHQFQQALSGPILRVVTEKTNEEVLIPLHPIAEEIWLSWQTKPPKKISNPEFNKQIKILAKEAKLNEMVQKRNTIKGEASIQWVAKHTMVKAHTTRRSFATNCVLMNKIPVKSIMAITGHKTEKAFYKYVRITKAQHAELLAGAFKAHVMEQQAKMEVNREAL